MEPDDEIMFGRALDESRECRERIEALRKQPALVGTHDSGGGSGELALTIASFELHGATLRSLAKWYPNETRIRDAVAEWERP